MGEVTPTTTCPINGVLYNAPPGALIKYQIAPYLCCNSRDASSEVKDSSQDRVFYEDGVNFLFLRNSTEVVEDPADSAENDTVLEFFYFLRFKKLRDFDDSFFHIPNVDAFAQRFVKFMVTKRGVGPLLLAVADEFKKNQK